MITAQAFIGVGANLGDRWGTIQRALGLLAQTPGISAVECSPVFESDPVGIIDQPLFLNLVCGLETTLSPESLLSQLLAIEESLGRKRLVRWGPRLIDLDLLLYTGAARPGPELELPHPRMFERPFVTEPLRLLLQSPGYQDGAWADIRLRLAALPPATGLRPWAPA